MNADEEYVRARWGGFAVLDDTTTMERGIGVFLGHEVPTLWGYASYDEALKAARAFTEQREREIAEVEEEIALIANLGSHVKQEAFAVDIRKRILARLQAVLSELQRGMTAALAVAREGYVSLEDVEKAMYAQGNTEGGWPAYIKGVMARPAPKLSPDPVQEVIATAICNECGARVGKRELHLKWHAALFPKIGGAK